MRQTLDENAITVFALLAEGNKLDIYDKRMQITITSFPHMSEDGQQQVRANLQLPDDVLSDILEDEKVDDINKVKEIFEK